MWNDGTENCEVVQVNFSVFEQARMSMKHVKHG